MYARNIVEDAKILPAVPPQSITGIAHVDGVGIDMAGYEMVTFICAAGAIAGGSLCSFRVQTSDDDVDGNYADVVGATKAFTDAEDDHAAGIAVGPRLRKRWVRLVATNGAAFAALMGGVAVLQHGREVPVTQHLTGVVIP
jgi:hypothetical protein